MRPLTLGGKSAVAPTLVSGTLPDPRPGGSQPPCHRDIQAAPWGGLVCRLRQAHKHSAHIFLVKTQEKHGQVRASKQSITTQKNYKYETCIIFLKQEMSMKCEGCSRSLKNLSPEEEGLL